MTLQLEALSSYPLAHFFFSFFSSGAFIKNKPIHSPHLVLLFKQVSSCKNNALLIHLHAPLLEVCAAGVRGGRKHPAGILSPLILSASRPDSCCGTGVGCPSHACSFRWAIHIFHREKPSCRHFSAPAT